MADRHSTAVIIRHCTFRNETSSIWTRNKGPKEAFSFNITLRPTLCTKVVNTCTVLTRKFSTKCSFAFRMTLRLKSDSFYKKYQLDGYCNKRQNMFTVTYQIRLHVQSRLLLRVSLKRTGHNAVDKKENAVCIMRTFAYTCWLQGDFSDHCQDVRSDDGPNSFWPDPVPFTRLSVTQSVTWKQLLRHDGTDSSPILHLRTQSRHLADFRLILNCPTKKESV